MGMGREASQYTDGEERAYRDRAEPILESWMFANVSSLYEIL